MRLSILASCLAPLLAASAQQMTWSSPIAVATSITDDRLNPSITPYTEKNVNITDDGLGGMIMCWSSSGTEGYGIYAQRLDGAGRPMWSSAAAGLLIRSTGGNRYHTAQCVGDGGGGAYVGFTGIDQSSGVERQYVQHVGASGAFLWGTNGFVLTSGLDSALSPGNNASRLQMERDGSGGVVIVYYTYSGDLRRGTLHAIRLAGTGGTPTIAWGPVSVATKMSWQWFVTTVEPVIASDGNGGAFIGAVVSDVDTMFHACVAYVNSGGTVAFDNQVTSTKTTIDGQYGFQIVGDSHGAVLAYVLANNVPGGVLDQSYALALGSDGTPLRGPQLLHNRNDAYQINTRIAADGAGGCYAVINDGARNTGMYLQHMDSTGALLISPLSSPSGQSLDGIGANYAQVVNDGGGKAICSWFRNGLIYVQKYSESGAPVWNAPIAVASGINPTIVPDYSGGVFLGWNNSLGANPDIFAEHIANPSPASPHLQVPSSLTVPPTGFNSQTKIVQLYLQNTGTANLVIGNATSISGLNAAEFALFSTILPRTIAPGTTDSFLIAFSPRDSGARIANLRIESNDVSAGEVTVQLTGLAVGIPNFKAATSIDAGHLHIGALDTVTFTITNAAQATASLVIQSLMIQGEFESSYRVLSPTSFPFTLHTGESQSVVLEFTARQGGPAAAQLRVVSNDTLPIQTIPIVGYGLRSFLFARPVNAGNVDLEFCREFNLPIVNLGTSDLKIVSVIIGGSHPEEFQILGTFDQALAPGALQSLLLQFCPTLPGPQRAIARLITNDGDTLFVDLRGWGGNGSALTGTGEMAFGTQAVRQQQERQVVVFNAGDIPVTVSSVRFTGVGVTGFSTSTSLPYTLGPGDSLAIAVTFTSPTAGVFADTMLVVADNSLPFVTALSGTVLAHPLFLQPPAIFVDSILVGKIEYKGIAVKNLTSVPQRIDTALLTGTDLTAYSIATSISWPMVIAAGATDTILLAFHPADFSVTRIYRAGLAILQGNGDTIFEALHGTGIVATSGVAAASSAPGGYLLEQNYPNPFARETRVRFAIPLTADVAIVIYDMLGREVDRLHEGVREAGAYERSFSVDGLQPGTYYYVLHVNGVATVRRAMHIMR